MLHVKAFQKKGLFLTVLLYASRTSIPGLFRKYTKVSRRWLSWILYMDRDIHNKKEKYDNLYLLGFGTLKNTDGY